MTVLHRHPAPGVSRHRPADQAELEEFPDVGRVEDRELGVDQRMLALARHRRRLARRVVAGEHQHAAVGRGSRHVGVAEHVPRAVDAGPLAVPQAEHPVVPGAGEQARLLGPPHRGRREVLVDPRLEVDVVLVEQRSDLPQLPVDIAERRAAVARNETGGIQPGREIALPLHQQQTDKRLGSGQEDPAGLKCKLVVERYVSQCHEWLPPSANSHVPNPALFGGFSTLGIVD